MDLSGVRLAAGPGQMSKNSSHTIPSMYGIFTYIWLIFMVNVGKYTIHGWYGVGMLRVLVCFSCVPSDCASRLNLGKSATSEEL